MLLYYFLVLVQTVVNDCKILSQRLQRRSPGHLSKATARPWERGLVDVCHLCVSYQILFPLGCVRTVKQDVPLWAPIQWVFLSVGYRQVVLMWFIPSTSILSCPVLVYIPPILSQFVCFYPIQICLLSISSVRMLVVSSAEIFFFDVGQGHCCRSLDWVAAVGLAWNWSLRTLSQSLSLE